MELRGSAHDLERDPDLHGQAGAYCQAILLAQPWRLRASALLFTGTAAVIVEASRVAAVMQASRLPCARSAVVRDAQDLEALLRVFCFGTPDLFGWEPLRLSDEDGAFIEPSFAGRIAAGGSSTAYSATNGSDQVVLKIVHARDLRANETDNLVAPGHANEILVLRHLAAHLPSSLKRLVPRVVASDPHALCVALSPRVGAECCGIRAVSRV